MSSVPIPQEPFDAVAPLYDRQPNPMLGLEERYLTGLLPAIQGQDVLDIGCGTGRWLQKLTEGNARTLTGVDPSACMLACARQKVGKARFFQATAESLPLLDASADVILLSFVLSYCEDLDAAAQELARVARPRATIFVSDLHPATEARFAWKRSFASREGTVAMETTRHPIAALESAFRRAGLQLASWLEFPFEQEDWNQINAAGKATSMQEAREAPAIYIAQFVALQAEPRQAVVLTGARVAVGAEGATHADLSLGGGRIASIGIPASKAAEAIDLDDCLVLPGLINAHDHLEFGLYPNLGRGPYANSTQWAQDIHDCERDLIQLHERVPKEVRLYFGGLRNLLSGVTSVCQHNPYAAVFHSPDFPVRVIDNVEWAHSLAFDRERVRSRRDDGRTFVVHAAEGTDSSAHSEIAEFDAMRALHERTVLVHALGCSEHDIDLINKRGASVVLCASSNVFLYGTTLLPEQVRRLRRVALGTDSPLTARGGLLEEIRVARKVFGASAVALYRMCTDHSARLLDLRRGEGRIAIGGSADLLVVRDTPANPADTLCGLTFQDIELIFIGGTVRFASSAGVKRLPSHMRQQLQPLLVDGHEVWVRAPLVWMFEQAHAVLGSEITISGMQVEYVG